MDGAGVLLGDVGIFFAEAVGLLCRIGGRCLPVLTVERRSQPLKRLQIVGGRVHALATVLAFGMRPGLPHQHLKRLIQRLNQ